MYCCEDDPKDRGYMPLRRSSQPERYTSRTRFWLLTLVKIPLILLILLTGILIGHHSPTLLSIYTRRPPGTISLLPRSLAPNPSLTSLNLTTDFPNLPPPDEPIPNILHYVYGLDTSDESDFQYFAYLAMRSAMITLKPERVMFHCLKEPRGYWWEQVKGFEGWRDESDEAGVRRGRVEVMSVRDPTTIGSTQRPVMRYAHKADILRLEILQQYGGIYLDIDVLVLRSFTDHNLLNNDLVLAMEAKPLSLLDGRASDDEMNPKGLCNAIILAKKESVFLKRWYDTYEYRFDDHEWSEHSIKLPWKLAQMFPTTLTILSDRAFFWPTWTHDHITSIHTSNEYDFDASGQLAYHLWESEAKAYLRDLNPEEMEFRDTSFTRAARRFMADGEKERWRKWLEEASHPRGIRVKHP